MNNQIRAIAFAALAAFAGQSWAQDDPHAHCTAIGWVPQSVLERPVPLRPTTGNSTDVVTTSSADARAYYLQGLNYLHGYAWIEGARSFHQALRADPLPAGMSKILNLVRLFFEPPTTGARS